MYENFWKQDPQRVALRERKGVYVFGIGAGKGFTPIYVGRATRTAFKTECFNPTNKRKYRDGVRRYRSCTPVLILVTHPKQRGRLNCTAIDEIETFFVQLCAEKNPHLQNLKKRKVPQWGIEGVIRCSRRGRRHESEVALKTMAGLKR